MNSIFDFAMEDLIKLEKLLVINACDLTLVHFSMVKFAFIFKTTLLISSLPQEELILSLNICLKPR